MKIIIIGGVAGGASTAARLRRNSEDCEIIMFERGKSISYANCGIPYHIGQVIQERSDLILVTPQDFQKKLKIDVRLQSEVISLDRQSKTIQVRDDQRQITYTESYDQLVLAPGARPFAPAIPGLNTPGVFTLRSLEDMDAILATLQTKNAQNAVIIGAGFIGLELAENLSRLGLQVVLVELANQVLGQLDYEIASFVQPQLKQQKIQLYLQDTVQQITKQSSKIALTLQSGQELTTDLVILALGVKPEKKLAEEGGLTIGELGGIQVDQYLRTSDPAIYALGDVIEMIDLVSGQPALIPLANSANKQGRIVADNLLGQQRKYLGTPATAIAKIFDLTVAITGASEKQLKRLGSLQYDKVYLQPVSHAGYYPGASSMLLKLLFAPATGQILGAQIIGGSGVDKRIDVLAAMLMAGKTAQDLAELELAYAPPYSSSKDPVNLAGMIALNQIAGRNPSVFWDDVPRLLAEKALFIDVRTPREYAAGHIAGAINIPLDTLRERFAEVPKRGKVILYCNQGKTAYFALTILRLSGWTNVFNLNGGYKLYFTASNLAAQDPI